MKLLLVVFAAIVASAICEELSADVELLPESAGSKKTPTDEGRSIDPSRDVILRFLKEMSERQGGAGFAGQNGFGLFGGAGGQGGGGSFGQGGQGGGGSFGQGGQGGGGSFGQGGQDGQDGFGSFGGAGGQGGGTFGGAGGTGGFGGFPGGFPFGGAGGQGGGSGFNILSLFGGGAPGAPGGGGGGGGGFNILDLLGGGLPGAPGGSPFGNPGASGGNPLHDIFKNILTQFGGGSKRTPDIGDLIPDGYSNSTYDVQKIGDTTMENNVTISKSVDKDTGVEVVQTVTVTTFTRDKPNSSSPEGAQEVLVDFDEETDAEEGRPN